MQKKQAKICYRRKQEMGQKLAASVGLKECFFMLRSKSIPFSVT